MCGQGAPSSSYTTSAPNHSILARLVDAHCHATDKIVEDGDIERMSVSRIAAMASTLSNQGNVKAAHGLFPDRIIPAFGLHPWFTHSISFSDPVPPALEHYTTLFPSPLDRTLPHPSLLPLLPTLPNPTPITSLLASLSSNLSQHPTAMLGEVGLDKSFRLPDIDGRKSTLATPIAHQLRVLAAQVELGVRAGRNVSMHSVRTSDDMSQFLVRCSGVVGRKEGKGAKLGKPRAPVEGMQGWEGVNVCLHSFGGSKESARDIQRRHPNVYFSFSTLVSGRSPRFVELVQAVEGDRILLESDLCSLAKIDQQMWDVFVAVRMAKGWSEDEAVDILEANWTRFEAIGRHTDRLHTS